MPTLRITNGKRKKTYRRRTRKAVIYNRPRRVAQNIQKGVRWFKQTGEIDSNLQGKIYYNYNANGIFPIRGFNNECRNWEQFKVLKVIIKWIPASVGSESTAPNLFRRGNMVTFIDQPPIDNAPPSSIPQVMNLPSARLAQPRRFMKRWMSRPRGGNTNVWTLIDHAADGTPQFTNDSWQTQLKIYGDNFGTGGTLPYFYYEVLYKVVFRCRFSN